MAADLLFQLDSLIELFRFDPGVLRGGFVKDLSPVPAHLCEDVLLRFYSQNESDRTFAFNVMIRKPLLNVLTHLPFVFPYHRNKLRVFECLKLKGVFDPFPELVDYAIRETFNQDGFRSLYDAISSLENGCTEQICELNVTRLVHFFCQYDMLKRLCDVDEENLQLKEVLDEHIQHSPTQMFWTALCHKKDETRDVCYTKTLLVLDRLSQIEEHHLQLKRRMTI